MADERPTQSAQTTGDNSPAINIAILQTLGRPWVIAAIIALALIGGAAFVYFFPPKNDGGGGASKVEASCGSVAAQGTFIGSSITTGGASSTANCPPKK